MVAEGGDSRFVIKGSFPESGPKREPLKQVELVYYRKWFDRAGAVFVMAVGAVLVTIVLSDWSDPIVPSNEGNLIGLLVSAALLLYGICQTANAFISTVVLFGNSIEVRTAFHRQSILFSEIRGRRQYTVDWGRSRTSYFRLVPSDDQLRSLSFVQSFNFDDAFFRWFNQLPDLDAEDEKTEKDSRAGLA